MARASAARRRTRAVRAHTAIAVPVSGTALLLIDVINDLAFEGSEALVAQAEPMALRLATLKRRASAAGIPTLDTLLEALRIRRVILTGIAGNICVLFTTNDAYMRDFKIFAPADCIVSNTPADNDHALRQLETVLKANITVSMRLVFRTAA